MLDDLSKMLDQYRRTRHTNDLSIVVGPDGAIALLREAFSASHPKVEFTDEVDELFVYDGVPVRMRICASPGLASLARTDSLQRRSCCDSTATRVMAIAMSWRRA